MNKEWAGSLSVATASVTIGLNIVVVKVLVSYIELNPVVCSSLTISLSGLLLFTLQGFLSKDDLLMALRRDYFSRVLWIAFMGTSTPFALYFYALSYVDVSHTFLLQLEVIYSIALSYVLLRERIALTQVFLSILGFLGIVFIVTGGRGYSFNVGDLLLALCPLFFQSAHVVAKKLMKELKPRVVVAYRLLIGGSMQLPFSLVFLDPLKLTSSMHLIALSIALISTANILWYNGMSLINLSKASGILITYPLFATIASVLVLGEKLTLTQVLGIPLTITSLLLLSLQASKVRVD